MIEFLSRVLTSYKADVSDHVAGLKKLKGEEAARAKETIEANEKVKNSLEEQIKTFGKVSAAVGAVVGGFMAAKAAMNSYAENARLTAAAAGVSIDKLATATKGLKTEQELLADAAKLNNGAIKLTTDQMIIAEQAMLQYTRKGHDNAKAHDAILQAVTALKLDGLKDLGVFIDTTGLSMEKEADRGKILQRVFGELTKASTAFANSNLSDTEKIEANANRISNAIDRLKVNAGKGVGMGIGFIESATQDWARKLTGGILEDRDNYYGTPRSVDIFTDIAAQGAQAARYYGGLQIRNAWAAQFGAFGSSLANMGSSLAGAVNDGPLKKPSTGGAAAAAMTAAQALARFANASVADSGLGIGGASALLGRANVGEGLGVGTRAAMNDPLSINIGKAAGDAILTSRWKDQLAGYQKSRQTFMEQTFGPIGQFDAYKQAWDGFTSAVTAGYSAMVDGTMSFGAAFKKAIADALKATGAQMLIESLKEAAYGVASLAYGNGPAAAAHFKSSAMFAAGSVAAGAVASQLGGGGARTAGGGGGGAGAGAPSYSPGAKSEGGSGERIIYVVGDPYDTEVTPRRRQNNARRLLESVSRTSMGGAY